MAGLEGRVALVTGAGRGIGRAEAVRLAADGARVAIADLNEADAAAAAREVEAAGGTARSYPVDVTRRGEVEDMVADVVASLGACDILVNNAGIVRDNLLFKMTDEDWTDVIQTHLTGAFLMSRAVQRHMVGRRFGKIVNTSSTSALGNRGQANYSAAKAGLQGFTRTLAIELGPFNINVNAVAPGFIDTDMTRGVAERLGQDPDALLTAVASAVPLRRVGRPEDVAGVVAFLCSEAASYVSGQVIYVRGGP